jgi:hypothetical protein
MQGCRLVPPIHPSQCVTVFHTSEVHTCPANQHHFLAVVSAGPSILLRYLCTTRAPVCSAGKPWSYCRLVHAARWTKTSLLSSSSALADATHHIAACA